VQLREAEPDDVAPALDLLFRSGLPLDGVPNDADLLVVARDAGRVVGVAGLELHEGDGLLRSVATDAEHRGRRIASQLCEEIELRARELGAGRLYLLTETAERFFAKRGYRRVDRTAAPHGIASSREFTAVCPASSVLMLREL
jgi:amino-acid N-acetyltransferase